MHYAILQNRLCNRKEYRVVLLNGKASHLANVGYNPSPQKAFSRHPHTELFSFAEQSLVILKDRCPSSIVDGLVRVDVMCTDNGDMVVNEFESLEADHGGTIDEEFAVSTFLTNHWEKM